MILDIQKIFAIPNKVILSGERKGQSAVKIPVALAVLTDGLLKQH